MQTKIKAESSRKNNKEVYLEAKTMVHIHGVPIVMWNVPNNQMKINYRDISSDLTHIRKRMRQVFEIYF